MGGEISNQRGTLDFRFVVWGSRRDLGLLGRPSDSAWLVYLDLAEHHRAGDGLRSHNHCPRRFRQLLPEYQYSYEVGGLSYRGNRLALDTVAWSSLAEVERVVAKYPKGQIVNVYHDRLVPRFCLLQTRLPWAMIIIMPILSLCFGGVAYAVWTMFLRKRI